MTNKVVLLALDIDTVKDILKQLTAVVIESVVLKPTASASLFDAIFNKGITFSNPGSGESLICTFSKSIK